MISATVNYLAPSVTPSLRRTGRVLTRRNRDGSDSGGEGVVVENRSVQIADARSLAPAERRSCEINGFELLAAPVADPPDFYDNDAVVKRYYPECAQLVREATGASFVAAFDHNIRSALGKEQRRRIKGGQEVQGPAHMVHGDYTLTSAPQRLQDLARPPTGNDTLRSVLGDAGTVVPEDLATAALADQVRFAIINVWRSIGSQPVARDALALCDGRSVDPEDLVVFEIHYHDRIGENYFARPADGHRWYTYPLMTTDEALLIKQWDSNGPLARSAGAVGDDSRADEPCTFSFHTAYAEDGSHDTDVRRESIETRCIVIYA